MLFLPRGLVMSSVIRPSLLGSFLLLAGCGITAAADISIHKQSRTQTGDAPWSLQQAEEKWQPAETAIIVCDMWDAHHCLNAVRRETELAPRMEKVLQNARGRGVLIDRKRV